MCFIQFLSSRSGKSSRACAPRLSVRLLRRVHGDDGLRDQIVELQRLDQVGIPDQRAVGTRGRRQRRRTLRGSACEPSSSISPVRNTAQLFCITLLHVERAAPRSASRRWRGGTCRGARATARPNPSAGRGCLSSGLDHLGAAQRRGAAEHHEIDQRVGAEPVGAVHRHAGGFAERHQAGHDVIGVAVLLGQHLAVIVRRDAAHVVVHGRQHRDRLVRHVDAGEDARASRRCPAAARAALRDRDDRGAGRCGPSSCRRRGLRGSRSSSRARRRRARRGPWRTARSAP